MNNKTSMQIGMVGLGRMGANMVRRLIKDGHQCVVYDRAPQAVNESGQREGGGRAFARRFREEIDEAARGLADGSGCSRGPDHR